MVTTETPTISVKRIPDDWNLQPTDELREEKSFSTDTVINAYLKGREDQCLDNEKILVEKLSENIKKAMLLSSAFFDILSDNGMKCLHTLLMPKNIMEFESVFIVEENDYVSEEFEKIYKIASSKKVENNNETFHFSYIFIPYAEGLNREKLRSDGYVLEYDKK